MLNVLVLGSKYDSPSPMHIVFYNVLCLEYNVLYFNFLIIVLIFYVEGFSIQSEGDRPSTICIVFYNRSTKIRRH